MKPTLVPWICIISTGCTRRVTLQQQLSQACFLSPLPAASLSFLGWSEQVETEQQNEWAAEAAARWTREISWEIDTDKSHTLRLPGRQLSVEEAAGSLSQKWCWVSLILCSQRAGNLNQPVLFRGKDKNARCAGRHFI